MSWKNGGGVKKLAAGDFETQDLIQVAALREALLKRLLEQTTGKRWIRYLRLFSKQGYAEEITVFTHHWMKPNLPRGVEMPHGRDSMLEAE